MREFYIHEQTTQRNRKCLFIVAFISLSKSTATSCLYIHISGNSLIVASKLQKLLFFCLRRKNMRERTFPSLLHNKFNFLQVLLPIVAVKCFILSSYRTCAVFNWHFQFKRLIRNGKRSIRNGGICNRKPPFDFVPLIEGCTLLIQHIPARIKILALNLFLAKHILYSWLRILWSHNGNLDNLVSSSHVW